MADASLDDELDTEDQDDLDDDIDLDDADLGDELLDDEEDADTDDDDEDEVGEDTEALEELEAEELELLEEEVETELLVDEAAELRAIRREELALNQGPAEQRSDEFVCSSCFMVKRMSQLASKRKKICTDCAS